MSELTIQRTAPSRALGVLALLGLGCWAALTVVIGVGDMVNGARNVSAFRSPPGIFSGSELGQGDALLAWSVSVFVLWILSLNVVLVAVALGVAHIASVRRSWRRCVAFASVAVAGPVAALVVNQVANGDTDSAATSYLRAVVPGLGLVAVAAVTFLAAWRLLLGAASGAVGR